MPVTIVCPACKAKMRAPENLIGKAVKCPNCSKPVLVKAAAPAPTPAPPPPPKKPAPKPAPVIEEEPLDDMDPVEDEVEAPRQRKPRPAEVDGDELEAPARGGPSTDKERSTALWLYLLPILLPCCMIGPIISLVMWSSKRKDSPFIDYHGKTWLNLMINSIVLPTAFYLAGIAGGWVGGLINNYVGMGIMGLLMLLGAAIGMYFFVITIIAAVKAKKGDWYEPKMAFKLLK